MIVGDHLKTNLYRYLPLCLLRWVQNSFVQLISNNVKMFWKRGVINNISDLYRHQLLRKGKVFMKAIVRKVNYERGLVVYEREGYDCGWFEILDTVDLEEDDELVGN